jgi:hypothetical protein
MSDRYTLGPMRFTRSEKWGDLVRRDLTDGDMTTTGKLVCHKNEIIVAVAPGGPEEFLPLQMQGVWAVNGNCGRASDRVVVTAVAIRFPNGRFHEGVVL